MVDDTQRTEFAQQAVNFADTFSYRFGRQTYGARRPRRLRLMPPDGPSTAGGRHARQPLVLIPDKGEGNMVLGWVDTTQQQAEIRTFDILKAQFLARFSSPIDLEKGAYERLFGDLESFFKLQKINIRQSVPPTKTSGKASPIASVAAASVDASVLIGVLLAGIFIGLGLGYILFR